jgi:HAD hydrolase, family IA, variant 3
VIHLKIINTINQISNVYSNGSFDIKKWKEYINSINPKIEELCISDMKETIDNGLYTFEKDFLPILNLVMNEQNKLEELSSNFNIVTKNLEDKIISKFGKSIDVEIVLYIGVCNGAGWVVTIDGKTYCFLGIEKILELNWYDIDSLYGLIYHELGHVYQNQYGVLERDLDNNKHHFLWQLFTEGIAMHFEQTLIGDYKYFHQDKGGWKNWCDSNLNQIKIDFYNDLDNMTSNNQRYFGDWVTYEEHSDVGYYLGTKFVQFICNIYKFDDILSFDIEDVERLYINFLNIEKIQSAQFIFFDVGTTFVDESKAYDHRVKEMIEDTEITFDEFDEKRIEFSKLGSDGNSEAIKFYNLTKTKWHQEDEFLYKETIDILKYLKNKNYKLGIIANQSIGLKGRLDSFGILNYFDIVIASDEVGLAKPNIEIFEKAIKLANLNPKDCIMVGDRLDNDIFPANKIGMKTIWIRNRLAKHQSIYLSNSCATLIINNLIEMKYIK